MVPRRYRLRLGALMYLWGWLHHRVGVPVRRGKGGFLSCLKLLGRLESWRREYVFNNTYLQFAILKIIVGPGPADSRVVLRAQKWWWQERVSCGRGRVAGEGGLDLPMYDSTSRTPAARSEPTQQQQKRGKTPHTKQERPSNSTTLLINGGAEIPAAAVEFPW